ncbi:MAG: iron-containing alcohol dehydrogenase [Elusimicrobiota bacterium]
MIHTYNFPTEIHFGPGARKLLTAKLQELGIKKPLLVTDRTVAQLPFFPEILADAPAAGTFFDFAGNPAQAHVAAGLAAYRQHDADGFIALGGGAAIDVAKAIALLVNHPGGLFDYEDGAPDAKPIDQDLPPIVAIPTTAGTGSEVGRASVISTDDTHQKKILFTPKMLPRVILADPELTLGLPAAVTAATGLDALTHLIEAYITPASENPMCDGIALEGIRLVARSLRRAVRAPEDIAARGDMLNAAMMGAVAFQKGLGAVHSCAHALSTVCDMHHGLACGIMLPHVMAYNRPAIEDKLAVMAQTVGTADFIAWIKALNADIGIPGRLAAAGVERRHLDDLVETAFADVCHPLNPRPVTEQDFRELFQGALKP